MVNKASKICLEIGGETYANKTKDDKTARQNNSPILRQPHHLTMQEAKQTVNVNTDEFIGSLSQ